MKSYRSGMTWEWVWWQYIHLCVNQAILKADVLDMQAHLCLLLREVLVLWSWGKKIKLCCYSLDNKEDYRFNATEWFSLDSNGTIMAPIMALIRSEHDLIHNSDWTQHLSFSNSDTCPYFKIFVKKIIIYTCVCV